MSKPIFTFVPVEASLVDVRPVPVNHTNMAVYALGASGRAWVRKRQENMGCEEFLSETLAWLLAKALEVPVPESAIHTDDQGDPSWLSEWVPSVMHWDPAFINRITNVEGLGALVALDAIILNPDRHAGNILLQPESDGLGLRVWAIDHGAALIGYAKDIQGYRDAVTDPRNLARGLPVDLIEAFALEAGRRASELSATDVKAIVHGGCLQAKEPGAAAIAEVLVERCARAKRFVADYLEEIRRRQR